MQNFKKFSDVDFLSTLVNKATAVSDSLTGLATINSEIALLDIGNVVVRKDLQETDIVSIISGGSSGLEPAYAQFVGKGMLTAAVQGELLIAPPCRPIMQTIREVALGTCRGILLLVPGGSGCLLNFGLATERIRKEGIKIKMLPVLEDYHNKNVAEPHKRGLSGIILVMKIAGAMSEEFYQIDDIYNFCQITTKNMISISFGVKESVENVKCICRTVQMGIGPKINGEGPIKFLKQSDLKELCTTIWSEILNPEKKERFLKDLSTPIVVLVNNVGGLSKLEELIVVKELISSIEHLAVVRVYSGTFFSSTYFNGFIITLLKVFDSRVLHFLDAPTTVMGWKWITETRPKVTIPTKIPSRLRKKPKVTPHETGPRLSDSSANYVRTASIFVCEALVSCEVQLNLMDSEFGNGNTGTRLKDLAKMVAYKLDKNSNGMTYSQPYYYFQCLSKFCEALVGGPMGCVFCIVFEQVAVTFRRLEDVEQNLEGPMWLEALKGATAAVKKYGRANYGDSTALDALQGCVEGWVENLNEASSYFEAFKYGVQSSEEAVLKFKKPKLKYPDPGAHAISIIFRAIFEAIDA